MTAQLAAAPAYLLWMVFILARVVIAASHEIRLPDHLIKTGRRVFFEMKPFALPLLLTCHLSIAWAFPGAGTNPGMLLSTGTNVIFWLMVRNDKDDDDRWRRRRRKVADRIAQVGGKLVVVPAGAR